MGCEYTNRLTVRKASCLPLGAVIAGILAIGVASLASAANERAVTTAVDTAAAVRHFDIKPQLLAAALLEFSKQADRQVVGATGTLGQAQTLGISGNFPVEVALAQLLKGTGLNYQMVGEKSIRIVASAIGIPAQSIEAKTSDTSIGATHALHLAQADAAPARTASTKKPDELQEVVVTGSQIRGVQNNTVPVTVLSREYIESTGISTLAGLIDTIPQNFSIANQSMVLDSRVNSTGEQGAAINLRGIGVGTTLVLLNGRRVAPGFNGSAVDISALPLSAVERVEVLTDGASALYGSDAVGGVVNIVLRSGFEGLETRLRTGLASGGLNESRATQVVGTGWGSGSGMISMDYYKRDLLEPADRDFVPSASNIGSLLPRDKNVSAMLSGKQKLVPGTLDLFVDALYTKRDTYNKGGRSLYNESNAATNEQQSAAAGLDWYVGKSWQLESFASYSRNRLDSRQNTLLLASRGGFGSFDANFESTEIKSTADGTITILPGGAVRSAVGLNWRKEQLQFDHSFGNGPVIASQTRDSGQIVRSVFAEVYLPVFGATNAVTGINALDVSIAGRFDDYSTFGSSFDPRYGISWEPIRGVRLRGSYGTSYAAPTLFDYSVAGNSATALTAADPGSSTLTSRQLQISGTNVSGLSPQESKSVAFGVEYAAEGSGAKFKLDYYRIKYEDAIAFPPLSASVLLGNPAAYGGLLIRNPSAAQVNEYIGIGGLGQGFFAFNPNFTLDTNFDPSTINVIVDFRKRNLSVLKTDGLDASFSYDLSTEFGRLSFGLNGTYILNLEQQVTPAADSFELADTFGNPPGFRLRGLTGWQRKAWAGSLFVNYVDSYQDNRLATAPRPISSYVTVDARIAYDFSKTFSEGALSGFSLSVSAQNLFDEDPPATGVIQLDRDLGFDPSNASPLGRLMAIEFTKRW